MRAGHASRGSRTESLVGGTEPLVGRAERLGPGAVDRAVCP